MEGTGAVGVLLALTGDDAPLVRRLDAAGTGLQVVRRCGDLPELLSAGMAGMASLVVLDTRLDDVDRTVLDRLERAGLRGVLIASSAERERWASSGWTVLDDDASVDDVRVRLQRIARGTEDGARPSGEHTARGSSSGGSGAETGHGAPGSESPAHAAGTPAHLGCGDAIDDEWARLDAAKTVPGPEDGAAAPDGPCPHRESPAAGTAPEGDPGAPSTTGRGDGRLLVVWGPHGAPGRTTVAASLAHGLARAGGSLLVDADLEAPGLVQVLGLPGDSSGLASAARLATHGRLDDEALARLTVPVSDDVELLSGLGRAGRWRELPPVAMREVWERARGTAAWTVVDVAGGAADDEVDDFTLEPGRGAVVAELLRAADVVVVVGAGDPVGVRRLLQLLGDLDEDQRPSGRVEVVVNRVRASVAGPSPERAVRETLERFGGLGDVVVLPNDPVAADRCLLEGTSVLEGAPGSELGRALAVLVDRVDPSAGAVRAAARARGGLRARLHSLGRRGDVVTAEEVETSSGGAA